MLNAGLETTVSGKPTGFPDNPSNQPQEKMS